MTLRNNVCFIGRLVKDIELREANGIQLAGFTLACNRVKTSKDAEPVADFVDFVAFGKNAEFASKWFKKGERVGVTGRLSTQMKEREGVKYKVTSVVVENFEFIEPANSSYRNESVEKSEQPKPKEAIDEAIEEDDLPF